ncbi:hypothetical protein [Neolewinella xylanilytica]|uniref:hypothetical protein n=1 Tax=Neolewinella xylanilytica TaxID=1514080 RepID=UPI000CEB3574|nr:hypothetical protein [Neolewinella xylanilytica]
MSKRTNKKKTAATRKHELIQLRGHSRSINASDVKPHYRSTAGETKTSHSQLDELASSSHSYQTLPNTTKQVVKDKVKRLVRQIRTDDPDFLLAKKEDSDHIRSLRLRAMIAEDFDELDEVFRALA